MLNPVVAILPPAARFVTSLVSRLAAGVGAHRFRLVGSAHAPNHCAGLAPRESSRAMPAPYGIIEGFEHSPFRISYESTLRLTPSSTLTFP